MKTSLTRTLMVASVVILFFVASGYNLDYFVARQSSTILVLLSLVIQATLILLLIYLISKIISK